MKKLFLLIAFLICSFAGCKDNPSQPDVEMYFNPDDLSKLALENLTGFWGSDSMFPFSGHFHNFPGYEGGIGLWGEDKNIAVTVFESQETAIQGMEYRINNVAVVIIPGVPNKIFGGKWWHYYQNSFVFLNQWNTIIELGHRGATYEEVPVILMETAAEIARRIDSLSQ